MKVFVSWSSDISRQTADILRAFLPCILQNVDVFVSQHDLESGGRWASQLASELAESEFGIICMVESEQHAPWLIFEAGALTKHLGARACGLLLDGFRPANVTGPMAQFQHRTWEKGEFFKLLRDINKQLEAPLSGEQLAVIFEKWWSDIDNAYQEVLTKSSSRNTKPRRSERDILEELLELVRTLHRPSPVALPAPSRRSGQKDFSEWTAGRRVQHTRWGEGVIVETMGTGEGSQAIIEFSGGRSKTLLLTYAPLKLLDE